MQSRFFIVLFLLLSLNLFSQQHYINDIESAFKNPPHDAKPRTWYHINSGNASKEGFTKDPKAIKDTSIGGVLVFNVSMGLPERDVTYNSPEHRAILPHAAKECEKLGLSFGVHNCDGWTSSGG